MKLFYRGLTLEYDPSQAESGVVDQPRQPYTRIYRGTKYFVDPSVPVETPPRSAHTLFYRASIYHVNEAGLLDATAAIPALKPTKTTTSTSSTPVVSDVRQKSANVHQNNMQRNLQHRLQVAQERGDQALVNLLKAELEQIA